MAKPLVSDESWEIVQPLLPTPKPRRFRNPGRKRLDDRKALTGILFVLKSGIPWEMLPQEMGCGSGMTCWRRLRDWQQAGVWQKLHETLLSRLHGAEGLDWSRACVDSASVRAVGAGKKTGPNPTDRGKPGSKHHVLTDANGIPLSAILTGANRHDVTQLLPLVETVPPVRGQRGRPRRRPQRLYADRAYDSRRHRQELRRRHIAPSLARRGAEHGSGLGVYRWVVERTLGWLHQFRRLRVRYERRADIHEAFLSLGCSIICFRRLTSFC
ncbi:MAG: IS5 family transposase [Chloroflexota bacterium]|nr:IS5 family transposase [Chloroflexota bacterium]